MVAVRDRRGIISWKMATHPQRRDTMSSKCSNREAADNEMLGAQEDGGNMED